MVVMTETAYMTVAAWEELLPSLVLGYRNLPIMEDIPQWWKVEIVDEFGVHLNNLKPLT
jgi:hypothetical protein